MSTHVPEKMGDDWNEVLKNGGSKNNDPRK
jgi:hypothetical protein